MFSKQTEQLLLLAALGMAAWLAWDRYKEKKAGATESQHTSGQTNYSGYLIGPNGEHISLPEPNIPEGATVITL